MAVVFFSEQMLKSTGGVQRMSVVAETYRDLVECVAERFPDLREALTTSLSVAIDGEIIYEPFLEKVSANSEVHFLHRISGG